MELNPCINGHLVLSSLTLVPRQPENCLFAMSQYCLNIAMLRYRTLLYPARDAVGCLTDKAPPPPMLYVFSMVPCHIP